MTDRKGIRVLDLKAAVAFDTPPTKKPGKTPTKPPAKNPVPPQFAHRNDTTQPSTTGATQHQNIATIGAETAEASGTPPTANQPNDPATDPAKPDAATPETAEAAGSGNNTTDPLGTGTESDPGVDESDDRILDLPGMEDHSQMASGTEEVIGARDALNQLLPSVTVNTREIVTDAIRHLSDAAQQGTFGQWQGAAQAVAHAVAAIQRAQAVTPDDQEHEVLGKLGEVANDSGIALLQNNQSASLPLPVKTVFDQLVVETKAAMRTRKQLPVITF